MIETALFYRSSEHVFEYPLTNPVPVLCHVPCVYCGAGSGEICESDCQAAASQVWQTHGAIASCTPEGMACAFCGAPRNRCVSDVFAVRLADGSTRPYSIRDYGFAALGAFTVYRSYIYTGEWPQGSPANAESKREFPNATSGGVGSE